MQVKKQTLTIVMVSSAILFGGGLVACSKSESAQVLVSEAAQYHQKGDNKAAIIQLKNALQKNPDDAEARYLLGNIYVDTGNAQSAEKELRKALTLGIPAARVAHPLGKSLLMQGHYQKVLDETQQADKSKADILTLRGNAYLALGDFQQAKESFELALQNSEDYPDALVGLARHALAGKNAERATGLAELAVAKHPTNIDAWLFKGDLSTALGKNESALAAYEQVLKQKPDNVSARIAKANIEIATGKFDEAKADIDAARKSSPNNLLILYTQALLDFKQERHAAALESLQQVLRAAPEHMPSVLLAGAVQYALGATQQAEEHLKKYLEKHPSNLYARKLLASTLLRNGNAQRAITVLGAAPKEAQQDPHLLALLGESYMREKDFAKASGYFEKASTLAPQDAVIHTAFGKSKLLQGDSAHGIAELERATSLNAKSPEAGVMLVMTYLRLKEHDKALAAALALAKEQPSDPLVQNLKGAVHLARKEPSNARVSFQKALELEPSYFPAAANLAQLDIQDKKPDAAKKRFESILEKDKKQVQALSALAGLALSQGKSDEATAWLERATNENPDAVQPAAQLAAHYVRLGQKQKALTLAQKLQVANSNNPDVLDLLAQAQLANDDKAGALQSYNELAKQLPTSPVTQLRIASVHMAMQNQSGAAEAIKKALSLKPDYLEAQLAQAGMEIGKGNHAEALSIAKTIQKRGETSVAGHVLEGDVLMTQKKPAQALSAYERAFAINKSGALMIKLHSALTQAGKSKEADTRLAQWLGEHPSDIPARMHLATIYLANEHYPAAIKQYQALLQHDPKNVLALNNLAWAYHQEKSAQALEYAEKAYQLDSTNAAIADTLGWILIEQGNITRGLPLVQKAASLAPAAMEIRYHVVLGLIKSGDKGMARAELEQLLATGKNFSKLEEARGLLKQL